MDRKGFTILLYAVPIYVPIYVIYMYIVMYLSFNLHCSETELSLYLNLQVKREILVSSFHWVFSSFFSWRTRVVASLSLYTVPRSMMTRVLLWRYYRRLQHMEYFLYEKNTLTLWYRIKLFTISDDVFISSFFNGHSLAHSLLHFVPCMMSLERANQRGRLNSHCTASLDWRKHTPYCLQARAPQVLILLVGRSH